MSQPTSCGEIVRLEPEAAGDQSASGVQIIGSPEDVIVAIRHFVNGRVLDFYGVLDGLAPMADLIVEMLRPDGIAALGLGSGWSDALVELTERIGTRPFVGIVVLAPDDKSVHPAEAFVLLSSWAPRFDQRALWKSQAHEYSNPDDDPRGPWRDPGHKGAKSGGAGTSYTCYWPPYAWRVVSGCLPPGFWRLNPQTGVVWGTPTQCGCWPVGIEATDSKGATVRATINIEVVDGCSDLNSTTRLTVHGNTEWLFAPASADRRFRISSRSFKTSRGVPTSLVLNASGGDPRCVAVLPPGRPNAGGRTRYWECSKETLLRALVEDEILYLGAVGGKPTIRKRSSKGRGKHAPMPSVFLESKLEGRSFFWAKVARSQADDIAIDWRNIDGEATAAFSPTTMLLRTLRAHQCSACGESRPVYSGCCAEHAVQAFGVLLDNHSMGLDCANLIDIRGRQSGVLFVETPVTGETLQGVRVIKEDDRMVLAARVTSKGVGESNVGRVSWPS